MILRELLLPLDHLRKRHGLRGLRDALDDAGVLHREEPLGHDDVKHDGQRQRGDGNRAASRV